MLQAIETRYLAATATRGARVKARSASGIHFTAPYDHALSDADNATAAARELAKQLAWAGEFRGGATKGGYVFVQAHAAAFTVEA